MWNISIWNWSNTMNVLSALWILMAWCFSTRASEATVLTTHPCVFRCLRVNTLRLAQNISHFTDDIFQLIHFPQYKLLHFDSNFTEICSEKVQFANNQHWVRQWLNAVQATSHYLNQWWLVFRCIYASLCLNELNYFRLHVQCSVGTLFLIIFQAHFWINLFIQQ